MFGFADSVSFGIRPNVNDFTNGVYQIGGLITYQEQTLGLEYKLNSNSGLGTIPPVGTQIKDPSGILRHSFPLEKLRDVTIKSNLLSCKIILTANSLDLFEKVHGAVNEKVTLLITRKERKNAESFVSILRADLSEFKLSRLSGD